MPSSRSSRASAPAAARRRVVRPISRHLAAVVREPAVHDTFFREMVCSMRNGVLAVKRDGALAVMNDEAYRIFGLEPNPDDIGRPYVEVLRMHHDIVRVLTSAFELSYLPNRAELRLKATGKVIGYTLSLVRDGHHQITGAALFFKDLTRVEQLEERERLRDRLAALGEMAAAIAHELKNPLAGIEVMAGLLRRKVPADSDAQALLSDIISEAKMANATVVEVLEYVRPIRLETESTAIADILRDAVTMADSKGGRGSIALDVQVPGDLPAIQGDHHQLGQVFTNLIINAFEAMEGRGRIVIAVETGLIEEEHGPNAEHVGPIPTVIVRVSDDGPGVPPELVDRIFNPFFTTKAQGSGLGLAIVRKIVDAHDGRIDVSSVPGQGTCFTVTLPIGRAREWFS